MTEEQTKQEIQKKYMELQFLDQQMKQHQQNVQMLDTQLAELETMTENLEEIKKVKPAAKSFVPLGSGIYVESEIKDTKNLLVNVGSKILVKKSPDETKVLIEQQKGEIRKVLEQLRGELKELVSHAQGLQGAIADLTHTMQKEKPAK